MIFNCSIGSIRYFFNFIFCFCRIRNISYWKVCVCTYFCFCFQMSLFLIPSSFGVWKIFNCSSSNWFTIQISQSHRIHSSSFPVWWYYIYIIKLYVFIVEGFDLFVCLFSICVIVFFFILFCTQSTATKYKIYVNDCLEWGQKFSIESG